MPTRYGYKKALCCGGIAAVLFTVMPGGSAVAQNTDKLSKFLLLKLSRDQSQLLCQTPAFTACMGFTEQACIDLSEQALEHCIGPLPDTIDLAELNSEVLEMCPAEVYAEAGYSNDKAGECVQVAFEAEEAAKK